MNFVGEKFDKNNPERFNLTWIISQLRKDLKKEIEVIYYSTPLEAAEKALS